jgi:putative Ca2+/H+ antiporter (TMEM165/GDT1 family)
LVASLQIDVFPLLSTFAIIAVAEFGDKTQIAVISLSAKHKPKSVFAGGLLAFAIIDGVLALIGGTIASHFPIFWINVASGILFLVVGVYTLVSKRDMTIRIKDRSSVIATSFLLVSVLEFGDKTQLAVITLAAEYNAPIQVFIGVMLAVTLLTAVGTIFGKILSRYISARYVKIGSGLVFLIFGFLFLFGVLSGIKLF